MFCEDDNIQIIRRKQIDTLRIFNDNVSEVIPDFEYKIDFTSGSNQFSLIVKLSSKFPLEKPILKISPNIQHQWTNPIGDEIISAPGLINFTIHGDLGRVVQVIIRELQLRPPVIIDHPQNMNTYHPQHINSSYHNNTSSHNTPYHNVPSISHNQYLNQSTSSSDLLNLNNLSLSELKLLNENEDYLECYVKNLPQIQHLENILDSLISSNEAIASENLENEEKLKDLTKSIEEKVTSLTQLQEIHEVKKHQYDILVEKYSPQSIENCLKESVVTSDEESEKIVQDFLNKSISLDAFLESYVEKRILSHRLKVKQERLSFQLEALQKVGY